MSNNPVLDHNDPVSSPSALQLLVFYKLPGVVHDLASFYGLGPRLDRHRRSPSILAPHEFCKGFDVPDKLQI
ncbi:hypothetical protein DPMN_092788 [Dreissena polymorpha]|uniref:Uncharacterized protein n=1 Tax=Dreissena polymorpha TaxID=45954 RepID=A0A9D4L4C0_DREPO|nr:hypothetical protein DPMN_092788 [Dreissena polymorpha]